MGDSFTLKNFRTGLSTRVQEWLLAQDAATFIQDGYYYQGRISKRKGLDPFAVGGKGSRSESESRLVTRKETDVSAAALSGAGAGPYTATLIVPVKPASLSITDGGGPAQTATDDGAGVISGAGGTTGTINYATGALSVTFGAAAGGSPTVDYTYYGEQITTGAGAGPYTETLDTDVQRGSIAITDQGSPAQVGTDDGAGALSGAGISTGTINYYTGALSVTFNGAAASTPTVDYSYHDGNPVMGIYMWRDGSRERDLLAWSTTRVNLYNATTNVFEDITETPYTGDEQDFFTFASYQAQASNPRLLFTNGVDVIQYYDPQATPVIQNYSFTISGVTTLTAKHIGTWQDRLVLFRTTEDSVEYPYRIRLSAPNSDDFDADGSDLIDLEGNAGITAPVRVGGQYIIFTDRNRVYRMTYTNNDSVPATVTDVPSVNPVEAFFSGVKWGRSALAVGKDGVVVTDGLNVLRADDEIPDYTKLDINHTDFALTYGGSIPQDKQHMWLYPSEDATYSDSALVYNYDEKNWAVYKVPLTVIGQAEERFGVTWSTLIETSWGELAENYSTWKDFKNVNDEPVTLAGTQVGHIYRAFRDALSDYNLKVRGISTGSTTTIDTDRHLIEVGDKVGFQSVGGTTELNGQIVNVTAITDNSITVDFPTTNAWTSAGQIYRAIPFSWISKPFNPYFDQEKAVSLHRMRFYVEVSEGHELIIDFRTDDSQEFATVPWASANAWKVNLSNLSSERGCKKLVTIYPGIRGRFIQFRISNQQPGAKVNIDSFQLFTSPAGDL